ncbi:MAG: hypothetical protein Q4C83_01460 [Candidatus Saccharibacteria bacterium]|nr:hypothetical protein [Candidatus Saccharibacteria bacterium]
MIIGAQEKLEIALATVEVRFWSGMCGAAEDLIINESPPKATIDLFAAQIDLVISQGICELAALDFSNANEKLRQMGDSFQDELHSSRLLITQARNALNSNDNNQEQQETAVNKFRYKMLSGMYACRKKRDNCSDRLHELLD